MRQTDGRLLKAIEDALARIPAETFGVCEACKRPIAKVRLEAVPWTRLCRNCKEREHPDWNRMRGLSNGHSYWWARDAGWY